MFDNNFEIDDGSDSDELIDLAPIQQLNVPPPNHANTIDFMLFR